ncbi:ferredoxin [Pusillimonas sp. T2]|uniref:2Fe-2S iron-sulfur cluster-binding protein n=1 Tax=Pusillimonas sp. T2 TaxID=1548123 RepID=UPI000B9CB22B|nr:2Fe-2S iron-sulfur cluster-binding protein [Pusillimonas sp. T2]OXR49993.1 ferredoxin [Pusillimonas sp. T2]
MTVIHYILRDGTDRAVDAKDGASLMENAIMNNVRGIEAECGGCCSCATCHVYVDEKFAALLPAPDDMENELLDGVAAERKPTSRLSCQISVGPELDGLIVHIPEAQY